MVESYAMLSAASISPESSIIAALKAENFALREQLEQLQAQVDWFKRQRFGEKSERRHLPETQRPGSFVILRYVRPVIRQVDAGNAPCARK